MTTLLHLLGCLIYVIRVHDCICFRYFVYRATEAEQCWVGGTPHSYSDKYGPVISYAAIWVQSCPYQVYVTWFYFWWNLYKLSVITGRQFTLFTMFSCRMILHLLQLKNAAWSEVCTLPVMYMSLSKCSTHRDFWLSDFWPFIFWLFDSKFMIIWLTAHFWLYDYW